MTSTPLESICTEQYSARTAAGLLTHLARHMEGRCARAGSLAALLSDHVANDPETDSHLRAHARELTDILEYSAPANVTPTARADRLSA